jgi:hypothetical protein
MNLVSFTLNEEYGPSTFRNRVIRIFGLEEIAGGRRKLHNEPFNSHSLIDTIRMMKQK